jgi:gluconolactonase
MTLILRDSGLSTLLDTEATLESLGEGFSFTEGPLWLPEKEGPGSLLVQDIKAETTTRLHLRPNLSPEPVRRDTRAANGQTFAPDGRILFCEQNGRRVSRMNQDGSGVETVAETWSGKRLNSPNDIVCRSDGLVYFTDPPYGVAPRDRSLHFQGVYALDLARGRGTGPRLVLDDFEKPNGLAFSPDESILYVCDTARYHVRAFQVEPSGSLKPGSGRVFARLDPELPGGPDGMKVDREGRVYVAVAQGVWVFHPEGQLLGILVRPKRPSNLAWIGPDGSRLAITAIDSVYAIPIHTQGILPPFTPRV